MLTYLRQTATNGRRLACWKLLVSVSFRLFTSTVIGQLSCSSTQSMYLLAFLDVNGIEYGVGKFKMFYFNFPACLQDMDTSKRTAFLYPIL